MIPLTPYAQRLQDQLMAIQERITDLLSASTIERRYDELDGNVIVIGPRYYWGETDENQKRLQMDVLMLYRPWIEHMRLLFCRASDEISEQINQTDSFLMGWIQKQSTWDVPASVEEAKCILSHKMLAFLELLQMVNSPTRREIIAVPDTNALVSCPDFASYREVVGDPSFTIVIMPTVLSELDQLKVTARDDGLRDKVRSVIRRIKGLRAQGSLLSGVTFDKTILVRMEACEPNFGRTLSWLTPSSNDDRLLASALELQWQKPGAVVILCTQDINLQNKAEMACIPFGEPPEAS